MKDIINMKKTGISFEINDNLDHPFYWWPQTLINYKVSFDNVEVKPDELMLINEDNELQLPFQLSAVEMKGDYLKKALVNFMSDLPVNGKRKFKLKINNSESYSSNEEKEVEKDRELKSEKTENTITVESDKLKIKIPASEKEFDFIPGPIFQINRGEGWIGKSKIVTSKRELKSLETEKIESGPLFITYRIAYEFTGAASYVATVKVIKGMDFVRFYEEIKNISKEEEMYFKTDWEGFNPTHRQAPNHPYQNKANETPGHKRFDYEKVDQKLIAMARGMEAEMSSEGEIPFRLGPYQPWKANYKVTYANFWDEKDHDALGIFIDKIDEWQDNEYAIWAAANTLQVRYFCKNNQLYFKWPLVTGKRSTSLAFYDHKKDKKVMEKLEEYYQKSKTGDLKHEYNYKITLSAESYTAFLQNRYGTIDLNKVKDWVLEYPENASSPPVIFDRGNIDTVEELREVLYTSSFCELPLHGTRENRGWINPVANRSISNYIIDYNRLSPQINNNTNRGIIAFLLLMGYVCADEDFMPMKNMLSGHPNFLADVKRVPGFMSFLFPDHPRAGEWADEFEKYLELNTRYHTRPPLESMEAKGGRWTENLGTYVWAFLKPSLRANYLLRNYYDGRNRFAIDNMRKIAGWTLNALSAPFAGEDPELYSSDNHYWGLVEKGENRRVHPPQGAHSFRRKPSRLMWLLGKNMRRYDPLLAEHIFWVACPDDDKFESRTDKPDPWQIMYKKEADNPGTNPHLESSKYTGYGIILRSAVDTEGEVSVHLQQIDEGPNYRWGIAGQGGCGVIYYYAAGGAYSHNGREDVGDRPCHDTDFCCNFGVWKDGRYKGIGRNILHRPFYDFDSAKFGEITSSEENEYSWPQYRSRSVMLVGSDYIITYDALYSDELAHRWSWFVGENDELPAIYMVKGQGRTAGRDGRKTSITNDSDHTKGVWYDGRGDCMAVVTHKDNLEVEQTEYGCKVKNNKENVDYVFQSQKEIEFRDEGVNFQGKAGVIRKKENKIELNLFHGLMIGTEEVMLEVDDDDLGLNINFSENNDLNGSYFTRNQDECRITYAKGLPEAIEVYIDGERKKTFREDEKTMRVELKPGKHKLQITTASKPEPVKPEIAGTENKSNQARVYWSACPGADKYLIEISHDNGASFEKIGETEETEYLLTDLENGEKIHVRVTARNDSYESEPADEYPVYVTEEVPLPPDGLNLDLKEGEVSLNWGQVLGVSKYRLYRRKKGAEDYNLIFEGRDSNYTDNDVNTVSAFSEPGVHAEKMEIDEEYTIYEYAVSAVNGNGEGEKSTPIDTDPTSWVNWDPRPGEPFRRKFNYTNRPFKEIEISPEYYVDWTE